jgi:hypothetical protein
MQSAESHLEPEGEEGAGGQVQGEEDVSDDEVVVDDADTDSENEAVLFHVVNPDERPRAEPDDDEATHAQLGETVNIGGKRWKRVQSMDAPPRENVREFMLRNMSVTDETTELDLFQLVLPVTFDKMSEVVKYRAALANDKYGRHWYKEHIIAYFVCLLGATQFKVGTDLWNKETKGMLPGPHFGKYLSLDRFKRTR